MLFLGIRMRAILGVERADVLPETARTKVAKALYIKVVFVEFVQPSSFHLSLMGSTNYNARHSAGSPWSRCFGEHQV